MPLMILPLGISGEDDTDIAEDVIAEMVAEIKDGFKLAYSDGILPGTRPVKSDMAKYAAFLEQTDPADIDPNWTQTGGATRNILDEGYLVRLEQGLDTPPASPYWLNSLSVRSSFDRNRREFVRLITQQDRATVRKFDR